MFIYSSLDKNGLYNVLTISPKIRLNLVFWMLNLIIIWINYIATVDDGMWEDLVILIKVVKDNMLDFGFKWW